MLSTPRRRRWTQALFCARTLRIALLVAAPLSLGGCLLTPNQAPVPALVAQPLTGTAPLLVKLSAEGAADADGIVIAYRWAFGDGSAGIGAITEHTYNAPGTYTVRLSIEDNDGAVAERTVEVVVEARNMSPVAAFSYEPSQVAANAPVRFDAAASSDPDGAIASYAWDFGDGATATGSVAEHRFTEGGLHTVTLIVTDSGGATSQTSQSVLVSESAVSSPVAQFTPTALTVDPGETVWLDASASTSEGGTIDQYIWDFGDGATASGATVSHRYASAGTYAVDLRVIDDRGVAAHARGSIRVSTSTDPVPDPVDPIDETLTRTFTWSYEGRTRRLTVAVAQSLVEAYAGRAHRGWPNRAYGALLLDAGDNAVLSSITQSLRFDCYFRTIKNALAFVQAGITDLPDEPAFDHPQFPIETLVDGSGDSEDTAILYASLIRTLGYRSLLAAVDTDGNGKSDRLIALIPVGSSFSKYGIPEAWKYGSMMYAVGAAGTSSSLGTDPWNLTAADFKMLWDASRLDPSPYLVKY